MDKTVADMLELTRPDIDLTLLVEDADENSERCESVYHATSEWGHIAEQPGKYIAFMPCNWSIVMCEAWSERIMANPPGNTVGPCVGCDGYHPCSEVIFVLLPTPND